MDVAHDREPGDVVAAFVAASTAGDAEGMRGLLAEDCEWTTPRGRTYSRDEIVPSLVAQDGSDTLEVVREEHEIHGLGGERVLLLYDTVYRWRDGSDLENRVPSGIVLDVRDGRIVRGRAFLDAAKAREAAEAA